MSLKKRDSWEVIFNRFLKEKNIYFFGAGKIGRSVFDITNGQFKVRGFLDNDSALHGENIKGVRIYSPEYLHKSISESNNLVIVTSKYFKEIEEQLQNIGVKDILYYSTLLYLLKVGNFDFHEKIDIMQKLLTDKASYLYQVGWLRSVVENEPIDKYGKAIPWIAYSCLDFLESRIHPKMRVFEWGTGASTKWWRRNVKCIISIEHDLEWYNKINSEIDKNAENEIIYVDLKYNGEYSKKILKYTKCFDIVVIDGRDRVNCAKNSLSALKDDGVILWDDTDRLQYKEGYDFLKENGFKEIKFHSMGAMNSAPYFSSIFYRDINCLCL